MGINSLSGFGGFNYNYRMNEIPRVDVEDVKAQDLLKQQGGAVESVESVKPVEKAVPDTRTKAADLENISLTFNSKDDFSFLGADFDIKNLDMEQAISDMKKDKIFEDYQFFVGSSNNVSELLNNEDGKIIIK